MWRQIIIKRVWKIINLFFFTPIPLLSGLSTLSLSPYLSFPVSLSLSLSPSTISPPSTLSFPPYPIHFLPSLPFPFLPLPDLPYPRTPTLSLAPSPHRPPASLVLSLSLSLTPSLPPSLPPYLLSLPSISLNLFSPNLLSFLKAVCTIIQLWWLPFHRLKSIERVFYDDTWNGRNRTEKFLEPLQTLIRLGESVSDSELQQYKEAVRPEWVMHHIFSSVSFWIVPLEIMVTFPIIASVCASILTREVLESQSV